MSKIYAIIGAIGAFLLAALKVLSLQNRRLKRENKQLEADIKFGEDVDKADSEIEQEFSHRVEEANKDIENDEVPDNIANPNNF